MLRNLVAAVITRLKHEPVAVWGVVIAAALGLAPALGVSSHDVDLVVGALTMCGIPVVRGKVTPRAALEALARGQAASDVADTVDAPDGLDPAVTVETDDQPIAYDAAP